MNMMRSLFQVEPSYTCESSTVRVVFGKALDPLTVHTLVLMDLDKTFEFPTSEERDQIVTDIESRVILPEKTQHYSAMYGTRICGKTTSLFIVKFCSRDFENTHQIFSCCFDFLAFPLMTSSSH